MDAALLQGIQKGKGLKKVDKSQIKDASGPAIEGSLLHILDSKS